MKYTTLKKAPAYFNETLSLIEKNFHYLPPHHYATDFSPLMDKSNHEHNHILIDENKLIGHIGVSLRTLGNTTLAFIGGIAIDEAYQGKGFFKDFFKKILADYENECTAFLLWSELHSLYERYGFSPMKGIIQTGKKSFYPPKDFSETHFEHLKIEEKKSLQSLYENLKKDYVLLERSENDWRKIFQINSTRLFIKRDSSGVIQSYFCVGKGMDLTDIIHEYAYRDDEEKTFLLKELSSYKLWLPLSEKKHFPESEELILALVKTKSPLENQKIYLSGLDSI